MRFRTGEQLLAVSGGVDATAVCYTQRRGGSATAQHGRHPQNMPQVREMIKPPFPFSGNIFDIILFCCNIFNIFLFCPALRLDSPPRGFHLVLDRGAEACGVGAGHSGVDYGESLLPSTQAARQKICS